MKKLNTNWKHVLEELKKIVQVKAKIDKKTKMIEDEVKHPQIIVFDLETDTSLNIGTNEVVNLHRPMHCEVDIFEKLVVIHMKIAW